MKNVPTILTRFLDFSGARIFACTEKKIVIIDVKCGNRMGEQKRFALAAFCRLASVQTEGEGERGREGRGGRSREGRVGGGKEKVEERKIKKY